jgi:hypothetical protein
MYWQYVAEYAVATTEALRGVYGHDHGLSTAPGFNETAIFRLHMNGSVRVFRQECALDDAIGSHACSLEAIMRVTNGIPLGCSLLLPIGTVICVRTLKARAKTPLILATPMGH